MSDQKISVGPDGAFTLMKTVLYIGLLVVSGKEEPRTTILESEPKSLSIAVVLIYKYC